MYGQIFTLTLVLVAVTGKFYLIETEDDSTEDHNKHRDYEDKDYGSYLQKEKGFANMNDNFCKASTCKKRLEIAKTLCDCCFGVLMPPPQSQMGRYHLQKHDFQKDEGKNVYQKKVYVKKSEDIATRLNRRLYSYLHVCKNRIHEVQQSLLKPKEAHD